MSKLIASRTAQTVMEAEFTFNFDDTMANTSGATVDFGKTNTASTVFEVINLPPGAVILGGEFVTETAFSATTVNVSVGDSGSATRYLGATNVKALGRTPLVPTGYRGTGENIQITVAPSGASTTGKATLRVQYIITGRAQEVCAA